MLKTDNIGRIDSSEILVFGGSYSNRQATEALAQKARKLGFESKHIFFTGDAVAYCADPNPCIDIVRQLSAWAIQGNCEAQIVAGASDCGCGFEEGSACDLLSKDWFPYTARQITDANRDIITAWPQMIRFDWANASGPDKRVLMLHGGLEADNQFIFASDVAAQRAILDATQVDVVLAGHCGIPFTVEHEGGRLWHNAGVIGMPANDGTPDGWYSQLRFEGGQVTAQHLRLPYEWQGAQQAMRKTGVALAYADTLETGIWPSLDVLPEAERATMGEPLRWAA